MLGEYIGAGASTTKLLLHLNNNANDSSGNGNNGTPTNISYVDGKFGQAASFNGSNSKIDCGNGISLTGNFTLSAWVYPNASVTNQKILIKDMSDKNYCQFLIDIVNNKAQVGAWGANAPTPSAYVASTSTIPTSQWTHILGTRDGSYVNIYINGVFENRVAWSTAQWNSTDTVTIGCTKNSSNTPVYVFNGLIDEVIVENRAWSAEEVKKYYTQSLGRFSTL